MEVVEVESICEGNEREEREKEPRVPHCAEHGDCGRRVKVLLWTEFRWRALRDYNGVSVCWRLFHGRCLWIKTQQVR